MGKTWKDRRYNKYRNVKVKTATGVYDSKREWRRATELHLLEKAGEIFDLREQVRFDLLPAQYDKAPGKKGRGKCLERGVIYIADFTYRTKDGAFVVEDAKGKKTKEYVVKRKMMLYFHGIRVQEV